MIPDDFKTIRPELESMGRAFYNLDLESRFEAFNLIKDKSTLVRKKLFRDFLLKSAAVSYSDQLKSLLKGFKGKVSSCFDDSSIPARVYLLDKKEWDDVLVNLKIDPGLWKTPFKKFSGETDISSVILTEDALFNENRNLAGLIILGNEESYNNIAHEHELNHSMYYYFPLNVNLFHMMLQLRSRDISDKEKRRVIIEIYKLTYLSEVSAIFYSLRTEDIFDEKDISFQNEYNYNIKPLVTRSIKEIDLLSNNRGSNIVSLLYSSLYEYRLIFRNLITSIFEIASKITAANSLAYACLYASKAMQILTYDEIKKKLVDFCLDYIYPNSQYFKQQSNRLHSIN